MLAIFEKIPQKKGTKLMKRFSIDLKSFLIGALAVGLLFSTLGASSDFFTPDEAARLKNFATCLQPDGHINLGPRKIIMLGSTIYDDGSQGGGLIIKGGSNRIHFQGDTLLYGNILAQRPTIDLNANLNMGNKKIILLGSSIYDDGSQGGGLIIRGGSNRVHFHGDTLLYSNIVAQKPTVDFNANLNLGNKKIIMLGSSIYDDGSEGGGLILRGGSGRIQFFGKTIPH
jgi:hypothetical protein